MKNYLLQFLFFITSFSVIAQSTYYVKAGGANVAGGGLSEAAAFSTVSYAVGVAVDGDKIIVVGPINQSGQVAIDKTLTIEGQTDAVITSTGTTRMYNISAAGKTVTFKNITLQNANSSIQGAVINLTLNSDVIIDGCTFLNNATSNNGGVILAGAAGDLIITNSLFNGNSAVRGGVVSVTSTGRKLTVSQSTFVNNTSSNDGGVMYLGAGNTESSITNSTFFNNSVTSGTNQSKGGALRIEGARPFTIENCLIYGNIATDGTTTADSDLGLVAGVSLSLVNSLTKKIVPELDAGDTYNTSIIEADLSASNLRFDATLGKVIYDNVAVGVDSPIDFGSDGNDAGSWDSGYTLSLNDFDVSNVMVIYEKQSKRLRIQHSSDKQINVEIYNVLGVKVLSANNIQDNQSIDVNNLNSGLYFVVARNSDRSVTKKTLIN
ncbi:T9SS type A sorting domain-containing protein [Winogradskyella sp.]|uniref:T9SS type A sorting domain-containing protein n=1 Tax=Winogradskyella sp. TaxID=1883156 RepID=UPI0035169688